MDIEITGTALGEVDEQDMATVIELVGRFDEGWDLELNSAFIRQDGFFKLGVTMEAGDGQASLGERDIDIDDVVDLFRRYANSKSIGVRGVSADMKEDPVLVNHLDAG